MTNALKLLADAVIPRRYLRLRAPGSRGGAVIEPKDLEGATEDRECYIVTPVFMTRRQFERLPDFEGF